MEAAIEKIYKKNKIKCGKKNKKPQQAATANSGSRQQRQITAVFGFGSAGVCFLCL